MPTSTPTWDIRFVYSQGQRVLKSALLQGSQERHTVEVFGSLRLEQVGYQSAAEDYERDATQEHVYLAGIGRLVYAPSLPAPGSTPSSRHVLLEMGDHLGSSSVVIDNQTGELVERSTYQALGSSESDYRTSRWGAFREDYRFTGKEEDVEIGLVYFGARYYHPKLGRFASADPLTIHAAGADPNPYAYVGGRVSSLVDPRGLCAVDPNDGGCPIGDEPHEHVIVQGHRPGTPERAAELGAMRDRDRTPEIVGTPDWTIETTGGHGASSAGGTPQMTHVPLPRSRRDALAEQYPRLAPRIHGAEREEAAPTIAMLVLALLGQGPSAAAAEGALEAVEAVEVAEVAEATEVASAVGAWPARLPFFNMNVRSVPTWGHTFLRHGEGAKQAAKLLGEAGGTGVPQGQWLDNELAAQFLASEHPYLQGPASVELPPGLGRVILPNGVSIPATRATLVPSGSGFKTAYPIP